MRLSLVLLTLPFAACTSQVAQFTVETPQKALAQPPQVSVVGVYHNGRLDADYWDVVEDHVPEMLGKETCAPAFSFALQEADPLAFSQIDQSAKENGMSTELMTSFLPKAESADLLVFFASGKTPRQREAKQPHGGFPQGTTFGQGSGASGRPRRGGGGRRDGGGAAITPYVPGESLESQEARIFELEARLFSGEQKAFVARVVMRYDGGDLDEAFTLFTQKLKQTLPGLTCASWRATPSQ